MSKKKKIIVMSSLVLLLAVTAVCNVLLAQDNRTQASGNVITTSNYFTTYRAERTSTRSEELLQLDSIMAQYEKDTEEYKQAMNMKMKIVGIMENELSLETRIKSLGFADAVVSIGVDSSNVSVFINSNELNYDTSLSIYNMLKNEAGVDAGNIIIMPVYSQI